MDREITSIIEAVRSREERRRRSALTINAALLCATLFPLCVLFIFYPKWMVLLWIPPLVVAAIYISRPEYQSIHVSREEASQILDATLKTKERVRTFALISQSSAAPDLVRSAFIAEQIREHIPPSFTPANILDLKLTKPQKWALVASLLGVIISLALFTLRPLPPLNRVAQSLQTIIEAHPELPKEVALAAQQSIESLSASDLDTAQDSLQRTQDEITKALASQSKTTAGERTIKSMGTAVPSTKPENQAQSKPTPSSAPQQAKTNPAEQPDSKNDKNESLSHDKNDQQDKSKEKQPSEDSKERSEEGASKEDAKSENQEQEGKSSQEKESKDDGKSQSGQSNKSEDGEGQGSGQGAGSSGSGSGNQGENQQESAQSQGSSGAAQNGKGQGEGAAQDAQGGPQSQSGSAQEGEQKEGTPSNAGGLEQLKDAVAKAQQEVQKEQQQKESGDQEGKQGEQGKGEGNKESSTGKEEKQSKGQQGKGEQGKDSKGDTPQQQKGGDGSKDSRTGERKDQQGQQGKGEQGKNSKNDSKETDSQRKEEGLPGNTGSAAKKAQQEKPQEPKDSGDSEADGVGEKSSMPDRSAQAVTDEPPSNGGEGEGVNLPLSATESKIGNENEQLDARFTGDDSTLEENKAPAQAKTTLEDLILAKPQGSNHKGQQPIPLEYRDILK